MSAATLTPTDRTRAEEAIRASISGERVRIRPVLRLGDLDLTDRITHDSSAGGSSASSGGEWGQSEIPISLDFTLAGTLPRSLELEDAYLYAEVEGILVPQMAGYVHAVEENDYRLTTDLIAVTYGALFGGDNATKLREDLEYTDAPPEEIVLEAAGRLPYVKGALRVESMAAPLLTFAGGERFKGYEKAGDVLARVGEQVPYLFRDTFSGFSATVHEGMGRVERVSRTIDSRRIVNWHRPKRVDERYSEVVVYRQAKDKGLLWEATAPVEYRHLARIPFANTTMYVPYNDATDEGPDRGGQRAYELAARLARETHEQEYELPLCDPFVRRGDYHRVEGTEYDADEVWDRAWLFEVTKYRHPYENGTLKTYVSYRGTLVDEERILVPAYLSLMHISSQVEKVPYGISGDELYFSSRLAWVGRNPAGDELLLQAIPGLVEPVGDAVTLVERAGYVGAGAPDEIYMTAEAGWIYADSTGDEIRMTEREGLVYLDTDELVIR